LRRRLSDIRQFKAEAAAVLFHDQLTRLGTVLRGTSEEETIYLDGLDEAFGPSGTFRSNPGLPGLLPAQLPVSISAILTSRPGDHLDWLTDPSLCQQYRLEDYRNSNISDVARYLEAHADSVVPPLSQEFVDAAAQRIAGNFYIAVR